MPQAARALARESPAFEVRMGDIEVPLLAAALHHGHAVRPEIAPLLALDEPARAREEDPLSGGWAAISPNRIVAQRSRFEVDLNRPPEQAVYLARDHAWGLDVWRRRPPPDVVARSLEVHSMFYRTLRELLGVLLMRHRRVLVLDLHSYNHRRAGPRASPDDPYLNPELNVGTGSLDRALWAPVVDAFIDTVRVARLGNPVDVRENVRFRGGYFPQWVHAAHPERVCVLALEVKKTFMDEWTGRVDAALFAGWREMLRAGTAAALEALA